jgi:MFS family permease
VLLLAFGLDLLLYSLVVPFLPQEAKRLGASPLVIGILFAIYAAGLLAAAPLAAWLTDRAGPRRTLLLGLVILVGSTLLFAYAFTLGLGLAGLFMARAAQGGASAVTWTAGLAILVQLYPAEKRARIFARAFTVAGLGALVGPPLGGVLYSLGGFALPFLVATGLVVLDGVGRILLLPGNRVLPATRPQPATRRPLRRDPAFRLGLSATVAGALALSSLEPVTPLLLGGSYGVPAWGIGVAFGALAFCFVLMQPLVIRSERRLGTKGTICGGLVVTALCFLGIATVSSQDFGALASMPATAFLQGIIPGIESIKLALILVMALLAIVGCALAFVLIPAPELLTSSGQRLAGLSGVAYGAIFAAYSAADALGILVGPVLTGGAVAARGVAQSFLLLALAPAICTVALALLFWRIRGRGPVIENAGE